MDFKNYGNGSVQSNGTIHVRNVATGMKPFLTTSLFEKKFQSTMGV
jgi:hypothetical protein